MFAQSAARVAGRVQPTDGRTQGGGSGFARRASALANGIGDDMDADELRELEELKANQRRDYLRLMELTARMKKEKEEKAARQREEKRLAELKELQAAEERRTFQAASKLQAWMRGYLARKGKKGGKGKKGKKKK